MSKYAVGIYWSEADQAFIAEAPELPGCAADGRTRQEALSSAEVVIRAWIETARELGRPIPQPKHLHRKVELKQAPQGPQWLKELYGSFAPVWEDLASYSEEEINAAIEEAVKEVRRKKHA